MEPYQLMPKEDWEVILKTFARQVKMTTCLADSGGGLLTCQRDRPPLCQAIRSNKQALTAVCSQVSTYMTHEIKETFAPCLDACDAGLLRIAIPVFRDGQFVGQVTACGLASEEEEIDCFLLSKLLDRPEEEIERLARAVPVGVEQELTFHGERLHRRLNPLELELPATA